MSGCCKCGFPLPDNTNGCRHYGHGIAHQEHECMSLCRAEIDKLRGMVLDLYLWLNAALATQFDRDFGDPTLNDIANSIDSARWREIKSVVGQAADEEEP